MKERKKERRKKKEEEEPCRFPGAIDWRGSIRGSKKRREAARIDEVDEETSDEDPTIARPKFRVNTLGDYYFPL